MSKINWRIKITLNLNCVSKNFAELVAIFFLVGLGIWLETLNSFVYEKIWYENSVVLD
jgi:hypothetical protein